MDADAVPRGALYLAPVGACPEFADVVAAFVTASAAGGRRVGLVRPLVHDPSDDLLARLRPLAAEPGLAVWGVRMRDWARDERSARRRIIQTVDDLAEACDDVIVVSGDARGTELAPVALPTVAGIAADVAAEVVFCLASAAGRDVARLADTALREAARHGAVVRGVVVVGEPSPGLDRLGVPVQVLARGGVRADRLVDLLPRVRPDGHVVVGTDHDAQLLGLAIGAASGHFPAPARVVSDAEPSPAVRRVWAALLPGVPLHIGAAADDWQIRAPLLRPTGEPRPMTPTRFEQRLFARARRSRQRIVLAEGAEDRVLRAADVVLAQGVCEITLLGEPDAMAARARALGLDLSRAELVSPAASEWREPFAQRYAELRARRGVTLAQAYERMSDVSYFGTMMVLEGRAGGMVSGAVNTTAHTIRPALEVIRTRPGISVVSSALLLCLADRVLVYSDCAVNPNPDAEQLADIAVSSADTAAAFGIEPRVALLSYSTGSSGTGPDVDRVAEAAALTAARAPGLAVDGPLQYDAAVDADVARLKAPGSAVAGRATVFVFPDLASGNIAYKAVQRSGDHLVVGPLLQGLNKPVNDLSRGSSVADIVNTIAATAIQAGEA